MIEVKNLTKYYGTKLALDKISFTVNDGEVLGFLGPNGAGKSTTIKIMTCFLSPTEGTVSVDELDVIDNSLEVRKLIGYLPEHPPLYYDMTVKDYLAFAARIKGVPGNKIPGNVSNVVEKCGLTRYYRAYCSSLSKGYRQRVGIAQAMIHEPKFLILDEPTIGLDPIQIVEIRNLIKTFGREHTVILSTHILPEVDITCHRVIIINDGKIVTEDFTENLRTRISQDVNVLVEFRGSGDIVSKVSAVHGVLDIKEEKTQYETRVLRIAVKSGTEIRPEIARLLFAENFELIELKYETLTLEQIFIKATMN